MMPARLPRLRGLAPGRRGDILYFAGLNAGNALNYLYLVAIGLVLDRESFGTFGALFGVVYMLSALGNTLQLAIARETAFGPAQDRPSAGRQGIPPLLTVAPGVASGIALLAATPLLASGLDSPSAAVIATAVAAGLAVSVPGAYGSLQGRQRFARLGTALLTAALARFAVGVPLAAAGLGPAGALAGVAAGYAVSLGPCLCGGGLAIRLRWTPSAFGGVAWRPLVAVLLTSLVVAAPTSLDVALVKHFLSPHDAGTYTGIAVLGRIVLFLPLGVSFIALPRVAERAGRGEETLPLLRDALAGTAVLAGLTAGALLALTAGAGWSPAGGGSQAKAALYWYLPAMVTFSLLAAAAYYLTALGRARAVAALTLPVLAGLPLVVALFHSSLTVVAQGVFALCAATLTVGIFVSFAPALLRASRAGLSGSGSPDHTIPSPARSSLPGP